MKPEQESRRLLNITRSKAKMLEFSIPEKDHLKLKQDPARLFPISIGMLGELASTINRGEPPQEIISELKENLLFSAHFFDSYFQSELNKTLDAYLVLLGSASYYLCDLPGSASVLVKHIDTLSLDLDGAGLEGLLLWLLQTNRTSYPTKIEGPFSEFINGIKKGVCQFFKEGTGEENLLDISKKLRRAVYEFGSPRQLLLGDLIEAVLKTKIKNSSWKMLPEYSGLPYIKWRQVIRKESFLQELWPAQHLLGKMGVLKGKSAIVQMPTSAGKTKATELVLRSAFLADRLSLAIIIAPFRALCSEIKDDLSKAFLNEPVKVDELSDALQTDFETHEFLGHQQILVVTPEKLLYVLRHSPTLASHVGLLIFDEGHQFDNGNRGITYELLLTSLQKLIPDGTQKVLISAVISNAKDIGQWLIGEPNVVAGKKLIPTFRSVGFTSWVDQLGRIEYVDSQDLDQKVFFVPRVIQRYKYRERGKNLFFPSSKTNTQEIALYLGFKLVHNGGIALFTGTKTMASSICKKAVQIIEQGVPLTLPSKFSDTQEVAKLRNLHIKNLGEDAPTSKSGAYGIFSHHGNIPHGIRLAVEHAMREGFVRFVICTSTLAQGVNLPIRYLIVSNVYQGADRIKVRDFHNLIGRAGRAGMHTEGSILFADPKIFDANTNNKRRWDQIKELLEQDKSEPCSSNLLSIFDPIKSDNEKYSIDRGALTFAKAYIDSPDEDVNWVDQIVKKIQDKDFSHNNVEKQIIGKIKLICAVENFLLSHWPESEIGLSNADVVNLAERTLAFFLADDQKKEHIRNLFLLLAKNISEKVTNPTTRKIYGRTLYGVKEAQAIERWVQANTDRLLSIDNETEVLDIIWPLLTQHIHNGVFSKFNKPEVLKKLTLGWINGNSFFDLLQMIREHEVKMKWGSRWANFKIDHVVNLCEGTLAYDGALVVGAVCEFLETYTQNTTKDSLNRLKLFQKQLKYGLPNATTIVLYELGFSDRVIVQDLVESLNLKVTQKTDLEILLKRDQDRAFAVMDKYPSYFQNRMREFLL